MPHTGSRYIISVYPQGRTVFSLFMGSGGEGILFLTSGTCGKIGAVFEHALTGENANSDKSSTVFLV
jgi:hypothetical protein